MNILRFLKQSQWIPLYFKELKNRLRRDKNLSDIENLNKARENLGLSGDVSTHNHDSIYIRKDDMERHMDDLGRKVDDSIIELTTKLNNINSGQTDMISKVDSKKLDKDMLYVGPNAPIGVQGKVWFCTKSGEICLRVFDDGTWKTAGAIWQ